MGRRAGVGWVAFTGLALALALASGGCARPSEPPATPPPQTRGEALTALLPGAAHPFAPSFAQVEGDVAPGPLPIQDAKTCAPCHAAQAQQWRGSAHALSSFSNPLYRVAFDAFAEGRGRERTPFCGGCHDPALLLTGGLAEAPRADDPRAHAGLPCGLCHGMASASPEGNGSWTWDASPIPLPVEGDEASLVAHKARVRAPARLGDSLCASCHRGILSAEIGHPFTLIGLDEPGAHRRSAYGGSRAERVDDVAPQGCVACHMPPAEGGRKSHRFAGGHTTLAAMIGDEAQAAAVRARLDGVAHLTIVPLTAGAAGPRAATGAVAAPGPEAPLSFDVVVVNDGVGHRFPGGVQDLRDTFLAVEILDAAGQRLASAGEAWAAGGSDEGAHRLRALVADTGGGEVTEHTVAHLRVPVFNHTVPARGAAAARYLWTPAAPIPPSALPLSVHARLEHRRVSPGIAASACEKGRGEEGQAFLRGALDNLGVTIDPCAPQPVLTLAEARLILDPASPAPLSWQDLLDHGRALEPQLQEHLGEAAASLDAALAALPQGDAAARAATLVERARVAGRVGRTDDALDLLDEAEALLPGHPAIAAARGDALSRVWRWPAAEAAYAAAAQAAPGDDRLWAGLAQAAVSAGDGRAGLDAAQRGLRLEPRSDPLLKAQMLALRKLGALSSEEAAAAWEVHRRDDDASAIKSRCSNGSERCLRGRSPVPVYELR